jgi:hypothetical protein
MKAHHGVVAITSGLMSIVSAWMNSDGHVLQPEFASYVGKYTTVVREIVSRTIDIDVSINTYSLLTPRSGRLEPFGGHSPDVRTCFMFVAHVHMLRIGITIPGGRTNIGSMFR